MSYLESGNWKSGQIPQSTGEEPETLADACGLSIDAGLISLAPVLGYRTCDGIVKKSIQRPKVVGADGGVQFHGQLLPAFGRSHRIATRDTNYFENLEPAVGLEPTTC